MAERVKILGVGFDNTTLDEAIERGYTLAKSEGNHRVVTPNSEIVYMAREDESLKEILNGSDIVAPDGIGVVYASKIVGNPLKGKVAGIELGEGLIKKLSGEEAGIYLLGAKPGVAEAAAENLCRKYPGIKISGVQDGYFKNDDEVIEKINASGARVLFVCLGAPKQEKWMADHCKDVCAKLMVGLGGSLDVFSGESKRAPRLWQKLGLEWLYRLLREPKRFGRVCRLPLFLLAVIREKGKRTR